MLLSPSSSSRIRPQSWSIRSWSSSVPESTIRFPLVEARTPAVSVMAVRVQRSSKVILWACLRDIFDCNLSKRISRRAPDEDIGQQGTLVHNSAHGESCRIRRSPTFLSHFSFRRLHSAHDVWLHGLRSGIQRNTQYDAQLLTDDLAFS